MRELTHPLGTIKIPARTDSLDGLFRLGNSVGEDGYWAADTESTGLDIYGVTYRTRLVQVGTKDEAWLLRPDWAEHASAIAWATQRPGTWWHNFVFDALSLEESEGLDATVTMAEARDTEILSRLLDPRGPEHGGIGHQLKSLSAHYLGLPWVKDARAELLARAREKQYRDENGKILTSATLWRNIDVEDEAYELYAGQDVFLTARLAERLVPEVRSRHLEKFRVFEHGLAIKCAEMQRVGTAFDAVYAREHADRYREEAVRNEALLDEVYEIEHAKGKTAGNAKKGLVRAFEDMGVKFTDLTPKTGEPRLTKEVMAELATRPGEIGDLARTIRAAKHAQHYADYLESMLVLAGKDGRIHPDIRPMRAATARMSISNPPLQQMPADDNTVRGALTADEGEVLISADYAQVEFRVAAAVSRDPVMTQRILSGQDLHRATAEIIFGEDWEAHRSECKRVGFGRLYRGTPKGVAAQTGLPLPLVKRACRAFDKAYPATARWGDRVQAKVKAGDFTVITATGRLLICTKPWAAVNYSVQSPARDIFATGIIRLHRQGLGPRLRLVVHDEVILSVPEAEADSYARQIEDAMSTTFKGIPITTEAKIIGKRWTK